MSAPVGRGGIKLRHAIDAFALDVRGWRCADFGCNVGGFTQVLLDAGVARVHAIDTGYGVLAWVLRNDPRVVVMERTNALFAEPPEDDGHGGGVDLVAADMGWTTQRHVVPAALRWLAPGGKRRIVTLIKPHYERGSREGRRGVGGVLEDAEAEGEAARVLGEMGSLGVRVLASVRSPILGGGHGGQPGREGRGRGNPEWLALLEPAG